MDIKAAVIAAHDGDVNWSTWEEYMAEILGAPSVPMDIKARAAEALVGLGKDWNLKTQAYEAAGFKVCGECGDIIGLDCGLPESCPECRGHGFVRRFEGAPQQGCAGCDEYGTRKAYDERQEASNAA